MPATSPRNPPALLLYLIPLNHLSYTQASELRGTKLQHELGSSIKTAVVRKLADRTSRTAPVSPHLISSSDARKSVSHEDMFVL